MKCPIRKGPNFNTVLLLHIDLQLWGSLPHLSASQIFILWRCGASLRTHFAPMLPLHLPPGCRFKDPAWPGAGAPCGRYITGSYRCWLVVGPRGVCTSWMATQKTLCIPVWNASLSLLMLVIFKENYSLKVLVYLFSQLRTRGSHLPRRFTGLEESGIDRPGSHYRQDALDLLLKVPSRQPNKSHSWPAGGAQSMAGVQTCRWQIRFLLFG